MILFFPLIFFFYSPFLLAADPISLCDYIDMPSCSGISKQSRRSSSQSFPSSSSAAAMNPSAVSVDRGFGVEVLYQKHNPMDFNFRTGTGTVGGSIISSSRENSFFGNRTVEIDEDFRDRQNAEHRYQNQKLNLAIGARLITKGPLGLDAGISLKRHNLIKDINYGGGISGRFGPFHFGTSFYYDDFRLELGDRTNSYTQTNYSQTYGSTNYDERFVVTNYSIGTKFKALALDFGYIRSMYKFDNNDTKIYLYSAAYSFKDILLNGALRKELSQRLQYSHGNLYRQRTKTEWYGGVQAAISKRIIMGLQYNCFLLRELSLTTTIFF